MKPSKLSSHFWSGARIFICGHTFVAGVNLALMLERLQSRVTGYGLRPRSQQALYELSQAGQTLCDVRGDPTDEALLDGALRAADPDLVFFIVDGSWTQGDGLSGLCEAIRAAPSVQCLTILCLGQALDAAKLRACLDQSGFDDAGPKVVVVHASGLVSADEPALGSSAVGEIHILDGLLAALLATEQSLISPFSVQFLNLDASQQTAPGDWRAIMSPSEALEQHDARNLAFAAGQDMAKFLRGQINAYLSQCVRLTARPLDAGLRAA